VTTVAGNGERGFRGDGGPATAAALNMPHEIRFDRAGNFYIAERDNHVIRRVDAKTGIVSTVAAPVWPVSAAMEARARRPSFVSPTASC